MVRKEIEKLEDIQLLVRSFYNKVLKDEVIGHYFSYVASHHWEKHLQILDCFWSSIIFDTGDYHGNPLKTHKTLHHFKALNKSAFERWLQLFNNTVDEFFEGQKAQMAKERALSIATIMRMKILFEQGNLTDTKY